MPDEEDQIVEEESKKISWDEIDRDHKKRVKEFGRRVKAPTYYQRLNKQKFYEMVTKKLERIRVIKKDPKNYKWGSLLIPSWAWLFLPNVVRGEFIGLIAEKKHLYPMGCLFDGKICHTDYEHANCLFCSRNTDEFLEGRYSR